MEKIRKPSVAGQFYNGNKTKLRNSIEKSFLDARGPKLLPNIISNKLKIKGLVVPHAGLIYSGAIAGIRDLVQIRYDISIYNLIGYPHTALLT